MSRPEQDSITIRLRSIELSIDNFKVRFQSSIDSQLSLLKDRVERLNSKLALATTKTGTQQANADLSAIIQETKIVLQKDLLHDTVQLLSERMTELGDLIERLRAVSANGNTIEQPTRVQQTILGKSIPNGLWSEKAELNKDKGDEDKDREIASLREEINRLYNLTEREPRFQPFWILRDAYPESVSIMKIARTMNAMPNQVLENLKIFEHLGLIEIREGEARATKLVRPNNPNTQTR